MEIVWEPAGSLPANAKENKPVPHPRSSHNCGSGFLFSNNMNSVASFRFILCQLKSSGLFLSGNKLHATLNKHCQYKAIPVGRDAKYVVQVIKNRLRNKETSVKYKTNSCSTSCGNVTMLLSFLRLCTFPPSFACPTLLPLLSFASAKERNKEKQS